MEMNKKIGWGQMWSYVKKDKIYYRGLVRNAEGFLKQKSSTDMEEIEKWVKKISDEKEIYWETFVRPMIKKKEAAIIIQQFFKKIRRNIIITRTIMEWRNLRK